MKTNLNFSYISYFFLELEMFQAKVVEKMKEHILCSVTFFPPENPSVYDIMWKSTVKAGRP